MTYRTTDEFLKMFGMKSLNDLPELPKYKLDSNSQIVIDEIDQNNAEGEKDSNTQEKENETHVEQDNN